MVCRVHRPRSATWLAERPGDASTWPGAAHARRRIPDDRPRSGNDRRARARRDRGCRATARYPRVSRPRWLATKRRPRLPHRNDHGHREAAENPARAPQYHGVGEGLQRLAAASEATGLDGPAAAFRAPLDRSTLTARAHSIHCAVRTLNKKPRRTPLGDSRTPDLVEPICFDGQNPARREIDLEVQHIGLAVQRSA